MENVDLQSSLEQKFAEFFAGVVSEWNPCYDNHGRWRYRWDDDIGAYDLEGELEPVGSSSTQQEGESSEHFARRAVPGGAPERASLRQLLDGVYTGAAQAVGSDPHH